MTLTARGHDLKPQRSAIATAACLMPVDWRIESLRRDHGRAEFGCGEPALDDYLARFALQNHESGVARTFVAVHEIAPTLILGYYSLAVGSIDKANLPPAATRRFPNFPLPIARLARLAVGRGQQGNGLGEDLLFDALFRCFVGVVIDAKHEKAKNFYLRYEFDALPDRPLTLWMPLPALRKRLNTRALTVVPQPVQTP
jgi:hypothetical protein